MKPEHVVLFMGVMEYPEVAAWREGYEAFRFGYSIGTCPYYDKDRQINWFDAYQLGVEEDKAKIIDYANRFMRRQ